MILLEKKTTEKIMEFKKNKFNNNKIIRVINNKIQMEAQLMKMMLLMIYSLTIKLKSKYQIIKTNNFKKYIIKIIKI